jgi:hypothetical protein
MGGFALPAHLNATVKARSRVEENPRACHGGRMAILAMRLALGLVLSAPLAAPAGEPVPATHLGWFKSFWAHQYSAVKPSEVEGELEKYEIEVDEKNGYLRAVESGDEVPGTDIHTFVMWRGPGDRRVFGYSELEEGPDAMHYQTTFWTYEQGKWSQSDACPKIDLRDFLDETKPVPAERYWKIWLIFDLPRQGTTIRVHPRAIEGQPSPNEADTFGTDHADEEYLDAYNKAVGACKYETLELRWDKASGKFVKGAKIATGEQPATKAKKKARKP